MAAALAYSPGVHERVFKEASSVSASGTVTEFLVSYD